MREARAASGGAEGGADARVALCMIALARLELPQAPNRRRKQLAALRGSIDKLGLLVPLLVRPLEADRYLVLAGAGRVTALRESGAPPSRALPCVVVQGEEREAALAAIAENVVREPLAPFDLAKLVRMLRLEYGYSQRQIADVLGKNEGYISELLAIFRLDSAVLEALEHGTINMKTAAAFFALGGEQAAQRWLLRRIVSDGLDGAHAGALVAAYVHGPRAIAPGRYKVDALGTIDARTTRRGRLRVTIEACDRDALWRLLGAAREELNLRPPKLLLGASEGE